MINQLTIIVSPAKTLRPTACRGSGDDSGEAGHRFRQEGDQGSVGNSARYRSEATLASWFWTKWLEWSKARVQRESIGRLSGDVVAGQGAAASCPAQFRISPMRRS